VVVFALAATTVAAPAAQTTFGADLSAEANDPAICGEGFFPSLTPSPSCTWFSGAPGASFYAPASGMVTAVRVRAGAVGGAMQVVVMRSLYENKAGDPEHPYFTCCFVEAYGPVFDAKAKSVTTVASALAMTEEATPPQEDVTTKADGDFLAISVLSPNAQIPAFIDEKSKDGGFYPAPTPTTLPAPSAAPLSVSASPEGAEMLINADLETRPETGSTGGGGGQPSTGSVSGVPLNPIASARRPAAAVAIAQIAIVVNGAVAAIPLQCLARDCAGTLRLQSARPALTARVRAKHAKPISYGMAHFSIKAGTTGRVKVRLSAAARKRLAKGKRLSAWANIRFSTGGVAPSSVRITLRR
jgi:hypothetical protein